MLELKNYQRNAVNQLKRTLVELLGYPEQRQRVVLKAVALEWQQISFIP